MLTSCNYGKNSVKSVWHELDTLTSAFSRVLAQVIGLWQQAFGVSSNLQLLVGCQNWQRLAKLMFLTGCRLGVPHVTVHAIYLQQLHHNDPCHRIGPPLCIQLQLSKTAEAVFSSIDRKRSNRCLSILFYKSSKLLHQEISASCM